MLRDPKYALLSIKLKRIGRIQGLKKKYLKGTTQVMSAHPFYNLWVALKICVLESIQNDRKQKGRLCLALKEKTFKPFNSARNGTLFYPLKSKKGNCMQCIRTQIVLSWATPLISVENAHLNIQPSSAGYWKHMNATHEAFGGTLKKYHAWYFLKFTSNLICNSQLWT